MTDRVDTYLQMFQSLLPVGQAWNRDRNSDLTGLLTVSAKEFSRTHDRTDKLILESHPTATTELLAEWEAEYGLPDTCTGAEDTIQERRTALVSKVTSKGGQSLGYFLDLAEQLGYEITITEYRPFVCGLSECGLGNIAEGQIITSHGISDDVGFRFNWKVTVLGPRVTYFYCGISECGKDPLAKISFAADLECVFRKKAPAHTNLIFAYE